MGVAHPATVFRAMAFIVWQIALPKGTIPATSMVMRATVNLVILFGSMWEDVSKPGPRMLSSYMLSTALRKINFCPQIAQTFVRTNVTNLNELPILLSIFSA